MLWVIITIVASLIFGASLITGLTAEPTPEEGPATASHLRKKDTLSPRESAFAVSAVVAVLWIAISLFFMIHTVGEREAGIVYNFSGTIAGQTDSGVVWTAPWQHIKKENISLQNKVFNLGADNAAVTKDQQSITARLAVNLVVNEAKILDLYRDVGPNWEQALLEARVLQDFKEITASFTTPQLTEERARLRARTKERLADELDNYSIDVVDVFIKNLGFSKAYSQAIEQKVVQQQATLREQNKKQQVQAQADQAVIKAKGEATANRLRRETLTPMLIQQQAIEKLNDNVQIIYVPTDTSLFVQPGVANGPGR